MSAQKVFSSPVRAAAWARPGSCRDGRRPRRVATGRDTDTVSAALGAHNGLLVVALDVTDPASAQAAVDRFARIDVLVNNAGNFIAGTFEEIPDADLRAQLETNFFGPLNVTRAVLPVMRAQRSGHVVTISSLAGLIGQYFCSVYAASKFAREGWMESLAPEVGPFGIATTIVEPGFFRTELLSPDSTRYAEPSIEDCRESTTAPGRVRRPRRSGRGRRRRPGPAGPLVRYA